MSSVTTTSSETTSYSMRSTKRTGETNSAHHLLSYASLSLPFASLPCSPPLLCRLCFVHPQSPFLFPRASCSHARLSLLFFPPSVCPVRPAAWPHLVLQLVCHWTSLWARLFFCVSFFALPSSFSLSWICHLHWIRPQANNHFNPSRRELWTCPERASANACNKSTAEARARIVEQKALVAWGKDYCNRNERPNRAHERAAQQKAVGGWLLLVFGSCLPLPVEAKAEHQGQASRANDQKAVACLLHALKRTSGGAHSERLCLGSSGSSGVLCLFLGGCDGGCSARGSSGSSRFLLSIRQCSFQFPNACRLRRRARHSRLRRSR